MNVKLPDNPNPVSPDYTITIYPDEVRYKRRIRNGEQIVRVFTWNRDDPRVMAYFECIAGSTLEREPTSLFLSEFNSFVLDALSRQKVSAV